VKRVQVIWSDAALVDLEIIYDFLAEKSNSAAKRIVENILARTIPLEAFPESGALQEPIKNQERGYRYLVKGNYKIIYSYILSQPSLFIETIFDTRQDPSKMEGEKL
jgi:toxin ParE1/3/4